MRIRLATLALCLALPASAETYRCIGADGRTTFSDVACPEGAARESIEVQDNVMDGSEGRAYQKMKEAEAERDAAKRALETALKAQKPTEKPATPPASASNYELDVASRQHKIKIGMDERQVRRAWGAPTKINPSFVAGHSHAQWVYDHGPGNSQYIYFTDGKVDAWN